MIFLSSIRSSLTAEADKWFHVEGENAMIEAVKLTEDNLNVVVRVFEMHGAHSTVRLVGSVA